MARSQLSPSQDEQKRTLQKTKQQNYDYLFWGQDAMKGSRKKWKIFIVSEMVHQLQLDTKINYRQFQMAFFQYCPDGGLGTSQKKNFKAKILVEANKQLQT